ncbi:Rad9-domain-containing protein [Basidiobolus meristosporus CBS 931.73]|uniref:Rad9-domain-containing protein n=1 Tax=Basidiobolus meristosporus CBS 931.73 TaxID=1314790 RepID=A0A1Y1Z667_9FUNG|nr:Rad9-domain-containing protein [Basidiobolus meristosporus CBS 931.73]|eukprot:ORY05753.1 Rad9-domain-containing protein [Basidiobolus meristosporus CBS 931.73]
MGTKLQAVIPAVSLKPFYKILHCLSRIGEDLNLEARRNKLLLTTINSSRSAFGNFSCSRKFFDEYKLHIEPGDSEKEPLETFAWGGGGSNQSLVSIFRKRNNLDKTVEKCELRLEEGAGAGDECRLVIQMFCKYGIVKTYKLFYEPCEPLHALYSKADFRNRWVASPKILSGWIFHFHHKLEEITLECEPNVIRMKSFTEEIQQIADETGKREEFRRGLQTEIISESDEFDLYEIHGDAEMTFNLKEFKAIVSFAETMSTSVIAHFENGGKPLLLSVQLADAVFGEFVLATLTDHLSSQTNSGMTTSFRQTPAYTPAPRPNNNPSTLSHSASPAFHEVESSNHLSLSTPTISKNIKPVTPWTPVNPHHVDTIASKKGTISQAASSPDIAQAFSAQPQSGRTDALTSKEKSRSLINSLTGSPSIDGNSSHHGFAVAPEETSFSRLENIGSHSEARREEDFPPVEKLFFKSKFDQQISQLQGSHSNQQHGKTPSGRSPNLTEQRPYAPSSNGAPEEPLFVHQPFSLEKSLPSEPAEEPLFMQHGESIDNSQPVGNINLKLPFFANSSLEAPSTTVNQGDIAMPSLNDSHPETPQTPDQSDNSHSDEEIASTPPKKRVRKNSVLDWRIDPPTYCRNGTGLQHAEDVNATFRFLYITRIKCSNVYL